MHVFMYVCMYVSMNDWREDIFNFYLHLNHCNFQLLISSSIIFYKQRRNYNTIKDTIALHCHEITSKINENRTFALALPKF